MKLTKSVLQQEQDGATSEVEVFEEENEFYNYNFPLFTNVQLEFQPGSYQFPFSFILEETLPGSFKHTWLEDGEQCYGVIQYSIYAGLMSKNKDKLVFDKLTFFVDQKYQDDFGLASRVFQSSLSGYCYRNLGTLMLYSQFSGTSFIVGEK